MFTAMQNGSALTEKRGEIRMSETRSKRKVEFIESYWTGGELGSDYQWCDNHGELIRCKDCKYWSNEKINDFNKCRRWINVGVKNFATMGNWFCADGERKDEDG